MKLIVSLNKSYLFESIIYQEQNLSFFQTTLVKVFGDIKTNKHFNSNFM